MNPRLSRALFRSFLRACENGRHPEVFGRHGAAVFAAQVSAQQEHPPLALPHSAAQVRKRLKTCFRSAAISEESPLGLLESVHRQATLVVCSKARAAALPIFDYEGVAALPGEITQVVFLEPRYLALAEQVLGGDGLFLMRPSARSRTATLTKLVSHLRLPGNRMAVACQGGTRVVVGEETRQQVEGDMDPQIGRKSQH